VPDTNALIQIISDVKPAGGTAGAPLTALARGRAFSGMSSRRWPMSDAKLIACEASAGHPKLIDNLTALHMRAIRLVPVGDGTMFGHDGLLAHPYMLGPNG
jgi:hypothetical protein